MTRTEKRLKQLVTLAEDTSSFDNHKHAAAIYIGTELISVGINQMKSHPLQKKFGKNDDAIYIHAEIDAIRNALKRIPLEKLRKSVLYVARSRKGRIRMSAPCEGCQRAIAHFGIREVHWTLDDETPDAQSTDKTR